MDHGDANLQKFGLNESVQVSARDKVIGARKKEERENIETCSDSDKASAWQRATGDRSIGDNRESIQGRLGEFQPGKQFQSTASRQEYRGRGLFQKRDQVFTILSPSTIETSAQKIADVACAGSPQRDG